MTRSKSQQPPVRLSSWRLGEVGPAGDLPEHQAAGVHVDPEHQPNLIGSRISALTGKLFDKMAISNIQSFEEPEEGISGEVDGPLQHLRGHVPPRPHLEWSEPMNFRKQAM